MRYTLLLLTTVVWGLWFGGTIAVFVFGLYDFRPGVMSSHAVAAEAANAMFAVFAKYQLVLAGLAVVAAGLAFVTYPSRWTGGLLGCLFAALGITIIWGLALLPMMQGYSTQGLAGSPEFKRLHGQSMVALTVEAVVLLAVAALVVATATRGVLKTVAVHPSVPADRLAPTAA